MADNFQDSLSNEMNNTSKKSTRITRRGIIIGGTGMAGVAATVFAGRAQAKTPEASAGNTDARFANKVVLITGATSGIGEATARAFAQQKAIVHFCGRREALGNKIAQEIINQGGRASYQKADVRNEEDVKSLIETCINKYGRIDIAFNNAGIESPPMSLADMSLADWNNVMTTNTTGVFLAMKYEIPQMIKQGGGSIVNTASVGGHVGFAKTAPYNASKHAIISLTKVAALEYADKNIRVNSISPGAVDTPMLRRALRSWNVSPQQVVSEYPIKRLATAEEMARAVMWLSSAEPACVVGTDIDVTGGYLTK